MTELALNLPLLSIFISAALTENIALSYFLGICPFISISSNTAISFQMGITVTFVMFTTAAVNWGVYNWLLLPNGFENFHLLFFILTIAGLVQILEGVIDRFFPAVYAVFGIFLPLITVNCAVMGVSLFAILREYNLTETMIYAFGCGIGWTAAITFMGALRNRLDNSAVPASLGKVGITMILAAIMAMAFSGLSGVFSNGVGF